MNSKIMTLNPSILNRISNLYNQNNLYNKAKIKVNKSKNDKYQDISILYNKLNNKSYIIKQFKINRIKIKRMIINKIITNKMNQNKVINKIIN